MNNPGLKTPPVFQRTPRNYIPLPTTEVVVQLAGAPPAAPSDSLLTILLPVGGILLSICITAVAVGTGQLLMMLVSLPMMLMSVGGGLWRYFGGRGTFKRKVAARKQMYSQYTQQLMAHLQGLHEQQRQAVLIPNPPIQDCIERVTRRSRSLWERSPQDADFLSVRLGIGQAPVCFPFTPPPQAQLEQQSDELYQYAISLHRTYSVVNGVAVTLPLGRLGAVGIVGQRLQMLQQVNSMLVQLATHHAPDQLKIIAIFPETEINEWSWLRWLPHIWNDDHSRRNIGSSSEKSRQLLLDKTTELKKRQKQILGVSDRNLPPPVPALIFVFADPNLFDGPDAASIAPLLQTLLTDGPALGAYSIFLNQRLEQVPQACRGVVSLYTNQAQVALVGPPRQEYNYIPDLTDVVLADRFGRAIAPLRLKSLDSETDLPTLVTLLELMGVAEVDDLPVLENWAQNEPFRSLAVPIGIGAGGEPVRLDMHERGHGPHGLAAGATGAGKSEYLQTLIASLAVNFSPQEVSFILIDYKGGGMAFAFRDLPHQIGIITNLEGNQSMRALAALRSELKRRQRAFDAVGVNALDAYQKMRRADPNMPPLPHLMIIADEFAELVQNQPEFMKELISAVRVGRSLGVHLLLATQKPSGVVNEQIWGNTRFRVCLRVEQEQDSKEMLRRPEAASLRNPGRAYLQVGMDEIFEQFQSGYGGAPYLPGNRTNVGKRDIALVDLSGRSQRLTLAVKPRADFSGLTQLKAVVAHLHQVAENAGIQSVPGPWLPPLPQNLALDTLLRPAERGGWDGRTWRKRTAAGPEETLTALLGILDDPNNQNQGPLEQELGKGNLLVIGAPATGKTTLLITLITSLALDYTPAEVSFYLVDFGGRLLKMFEALPHVGAVLLPDEDERLKRTIQFLLGELDRRKNLLSAAGVGNLSSYNHQTSQALPEIVFVVDNYTEFHKTFAELSEKLERVAREGVNMGIHLVVSANNFAGVPARLSTNFNQAICFELTDAGEYSSVVGRTGGLAPERGVTGRGLVRRTPPLEFQAALPPGGALEQERSTAMKELFETMRSAWTGVVPQGISVLADSIALSELLPRSLTWDTSPGKPFIVPIGVEAETLLPFEFNLDNGPHFLITGAAGGGKTSLLETLLLSLAERFPPSRLKMYIFAMGSARLLPFSRLPQCAAFIEDNERLATGVNELIADLDVRRKALEELRRSSDGLVDEVAFLSRYPALLLASDDFDIFRTACSEPNKKLLDNLISRRGLGLHLIFAGPPADFSATMDPVARTLKNGQTGFVVGTNDANDLGVLSLRPARSGQFVPGRTYFSRRGRFQILQTAAVFLGEPDLVTWIQAICRKREEGNLQEK